MRISSNAVVLWIVLQAIFLVVLRRFDRGLAAAGVADRPRDQRTNAWLFLFSATFLGATILTGARLDYALHVGIWDVILKGGVPWWRSESWGVYNPYGPLFAVLAPLRMMDALAPKLLHAFSYVLFVTWVLKRASSFRAAHRFPTTALIAWILNPLPWVEIAYVGHFDILVGLACVAAIHSQRRGGDAAAGTALGLGVLLKFFPLVILPFLALDRKRVRVRLLASSLLVVFLGMTASVLYWGMATFQPVMYFSRGPNQLSIFRFLWGPLSPLKPWLGPEQVHALAMPSLVIAGLAVFVAWWWCSISAPTGAAMAVLTTLVFFPIGFLGYYMVLFVVAWHWYMTFPDPGWLAADRFMRIAFAAYFCFLGGFGVFMYGVGLSAYFNGRWAWVEDAVGAPAFLLGLLLFAAFWRGSRRESLVGAAGGAA